ncbi:hypothetical protein GOP47_0017196 [Adiantum capillus-veneris]|uniref:Uncharacterized protein n=1 Tax=Adiantum capillus-veneris TaxID=13818 RepID=A0A9D4UK27_ADICA|nr:hypothetical protein GOP47_0017196 [Adiantum capillus-veneris]
MVVPLKLTQFYGHRVPRPRIYPDVKLNDQRVDPPPSVNDALLSWAADAHWSMGGLSFKRFRTQGKMEGSVRKLRAFLEEDSDEDGGDMTKPSVKESKKSVDAAENVKSSTSWKGSSRSVEKRKDGEEEVVEATPARKMPSAKENRKFVVVTEIGKSSIRKEASRSVEMRKHGEEELVEATPARTLRRRRIVEDSEDESPICVPATEERSHRGLAKSTFALKGRTKKRAPSVKDVLVESPNLLPVRREKQEGKLASTTSQWGVKGPYNSAARQSPEGSDGGRLTRSVKKAHAVQPSSPLHAPRKASRARKVLMASDDESSESDDGLEDFLKEKSRPLRRSTRLGKTEGKTFDSGSDSD